MILISRDEKDKLVAAIPDLEYVRTCKQNSKRGKYYTPEYAKTLKLLSKIRKGQVVPAK